MTEKKASNFALLPKDKMREIASKGGKTAHSKGTARKWTKEEAIKFAELGGRISREKYLKKKEEQKAEQLLKKYNVKDVSVNDVLELIG